MSATAWRYRSASIILLTLALVLSAFDLDVRPLHSDEGVNHFLTQKALRDGFYAYSHQNYHGPLYFYLLAAAIAVFGDSVSVLRGLSVACFLGMLTILLGAHRLCSRRFSLLAALLLTLSPSMLFYARYAIHEMLFCLLICVCALSCIGLLSSSLRRYWYAATSSAALLVCTKETFIISAASLALAMAVCTPTRLPQLLLLARQQWLHLCTGILLAFTIVVFVYSGGLRSWDPIYELLQAIPQWVQRGSSDSGHFKPFMYYLRELLWTAEAPLLLLSTVFSVSALAMQSRAIAPWSFSERAHDLRALKFFGVLALSNLIIYSSIPYKTPWLVINSTLPLSLLAAASIACCMQSPLRLARAAVVLAIALLTLNWYVSAASYVYSSLPGPIAFKGFARSNPYGYAHTSSDIFALARRLEAIAISAPESEILIHAEGYWPLPYYLRGFASQIRYLPPSARVEHPEAFSAIVHEHIVHEGNETSPQVAAASQRFELRPGKVLLVSERRRRTYSRSQAPSDAQPR